MAIRLGVNIDHVATLRRLRDTPYPDVVQAAQLCIEGGADQITVHLREDRRHIVDRDVRQLRSKITVDLNLEMAATLEMLEIALDVKPYSICIVPEKREERTTEGGLNLHDPGRLELLKKITFDARQAGIMVSYFIEPTASDVARSFELGAQAVELHTGTLCTAIQSQDHTKAAQEWGKLRHAVDVGVKMNLRVHAGHGIDYAIAKDLAQIANITEYNIGHAIVCEALNGGLKTAVSKMKQILTENQT